MCKERHKNAGVYSIKYLNRILWSTAGRRLSGSSLAS